jgi:hypothetical protein
MNDFWWTVLGSMTASRRLRKMGVKFGFILIVVFGLLFLIDHEPIWLLAGCGTGVIFVIYGVLSSGAAWLMKIGVEDVETDFIEKAPVAADAPDLRLIRPLANQGEAIAQNSLGVAYGGGQGVPQEFIQAHMWFNLSAAQGNQDAVINRDLVAMTPAQIAEAQKLASEWKPTTQPVR